MPRGGQRTRAKGANGCCVGAGRAVPDNGTVEEVRVAIRVRPGASRTAVGGAHPGPRGVALVVAVTARAVDGRATEAALRALAGALGLPRRRLRVITGATSRDKLVGVEVEPGDPGVPRRLAQLLGTP